MARSELAVLVAQGRQALQWHRRLVAAVLAGVAVVAALTVLAPHQAGSRQVWAAARDLSGGAPLHAGDVVLLRLPTSAVPAGALVAGATVVGRFLAAPVRRGEPLTDVRLLGPSLLAALPRHGLVAVPVRVADGAAAAAVTRPGDVVDVLATGDLTGDATSAEPEVVAAGVTVLAVPVHDGGDDAGLVVVAVTPDQAAAIASAADTRRLSLVLRP